MGKTKSSVRNSGTRIFVLKRAALYGKWPCLKSSSNDANHDLDLKGLKIQLKSVYNALNILMKNIGIRGRT